MVRFRLLSRNRYSCGCPVSIPQWFDSDNYSDEFHGGNFFVSIPQWFDSDLLPTEQHGNHIQFQSHNGSIQTEVVARERHRLKRFNPTMVRFRRSGKAGLTAKMSSFNPTMVRFRLSVLYMLIVKYLVSIPQWFDSDDASTVIIIFKVRFQSHNGSIQTRFA